MVTSKRTRRPNVAPPALEATLVPLASIRRLPRNPKAHALTEIDSSIRRWGFLERIMIARPSGHLISGHGRIDTLAQLKESGGAPPANITVEGDDWLVPADYVSIPESEEEAAAVALNRLVEVGGWDDARLAEVLQSASEQPQGLDGTGFSAEDLAELLERLNPTEPDAPIEFGEYGENISTAYCCPKCGYTWSGRAAPPPPK